ncbi:hypothetical protein M433DRAFT_206941 [Acidomyces richmondensis BFW]|nr:MAG: hypothetical protein FE78DRAFT_30700 [Acidomyces sp. 'richmondensis']KYG46337.1 hypothetical protein M433DRAFT_206941 [Acidomyces richmondensis BFW]
MECSYATLPPPLSLRDSDQRTAHILISEQPMWKLDILDAYNKFQLHQMHPYYSPPRCPTLNSVEQDPLMNPLSETTGTLYFTDPDVSSYSWLQGNSSPSDSGFSSSYFGRSDTENTPFSSPETRYASYTPDTTVCENQAFNDNDGQRTYEAGDYMAPRPCVALHEVQFLADAQVENGTFEDALVAYTFQEGYHPLQDQNLGPETLVVASHDHCVEDMDRSAARRTTPVLRRRRSSYRQRSTLAPYLPSKTGKRPLLGKRSTSHEGHHANTQITPHRSFPCPFIVYGCKSTFDSKNEWKRHVITQHMQLGYWRCDQCPKSDRKPNDFNRKDLFIQHVRRMHSPGVDEKKSKRRASGNIRGGKSEMEDQAEAEVAQRCYHKQRSPPEKSACIFCNKEFDGPNSWEERLEHIGKHMESTKKDGKYPVHPKQWRFDGTMEEYLAREGLITQRDGQWELTDKC